MLFEVVVGMGSAVGGKFGYTVGTMRGQEHSRLSDETAARLRESPVNLLLRNNAPMVDQTSYKAKLLNTFGCTAISLAQINTFTIPYVSLVDVYPQTLQIIAACNLFYGLAHSVAYWRSSGKPKKPKEPGEKLSIKQRILRKMPAYQGNPEPVMMEPYYQDLE